MVGIAVVDDEQEYCEQICNITSEVLEKQQIDYKIKSFNTAGGLLNKLDDGAVFNLYILDIELPDIDGMTLAQNIRERDKYSHIIFATSYSQFAIEGYDVGAYQYLLKDTIQTKLAEVLQKLLSESGMEKEESFYTISTNSRIEKIRYSDIFWIAKDKKNVEFVTSDGNYQQRATLSDVYSALPEGEFCFIERGIIVNLAYVEQIIKNEVHMKNGSILYASRTHSAKLKHTLAAYWGNKI